MPVRITPEDPKFKDSGTDCLDFVRSAPAPSCTLGILWYFYFPVPIFLLHQIKNQKSHQVKKNLAILSVYIQNNLSACQKHLLLVKL